MNRIFLIGYMGSGKTTLGKLLAESLGWGFIDMDSHIEAKEFKSVSLIFDEKGEQEFRLLEQKCLHEVADFENVVISTGGGVPCFFNNMDYMNAHGTTVYLEFSACELAERLEISPINKRPLLAELKGEELRLFVADSLAKREPFYRQATFSVSGTIEETIQKIEKQLNDLQLKNVTKQNL
jgi:shikimate kinase